jgi:hypothetical protein
LINIKEWGLEKQQNIDSKREGLLILLQDELIAPNFIHSLRVAES